MLRTHVAFAVIFIWGLGAACSDDASTPDAQRSPPFYPADYATTYQEVRDCRYSLDHDLMRIRVLAPADQAAAYLARTGPMPAGTVLVKEQYDAADMTCAGPIKKHTAMLRLEPGTSPQTLDWDWQELDGNRQNVTEDVQRCSQCHYDCEAGFDGTCAKEMTPVRAR